MPTYSASTHSYSDILSVRMGFRVCNISPCRDQAAKRLLISVIVPIGGCAAIVVLVYLYWRLQMSPVSRRLIGASRGAVANQKDLAYELRTKYEAVMVLGSGSYGVVIDAYLLSNKKRTIRRAIKLVHARNGRFGQKELRRLNREVLRGSISVHGRKHLTKYPLQATILGSVDSPNVVQYLESGVSKRKDVYWFVMELLVGEALDEWLDSHNVMPELEAVKVLTTLLNVHDLGTNSNSLSAGWLGCVCRIEGLTHAWRNTQVYIGVLIHRCT